MIQKACYKYSNSSGVALVSVLLMLALMVTLLAYMVESQFLSIRQTNAQQIDELSVLEASHAEVWGQSLLTKPERKNYEADMLSEAWATESFLSENPVKKTAALIDLQGKVNLNNLSGSNQAQWLPIFQQLLKSLDIEETLVFAIIDWIDEDQSPKNANGAEDNEYLSDASPKRTANQAMSSVEELLMIKGVTPEIFQKLLPHITVVAEKNLKVNMNTATLELVRAILPNGLTSGFPEQLVSARADSGFESMQELLENDFMAGIGDSLNELIDVKSQYFEMDSRVDLDVEKKIRTGIKRELLDDAISFSIIYRKRML